MPQLILQAVDSLTEKDGSSKDAISKYIESNHTNLPEDHADQLSESLEKMTKSGEIVFVNDSYKKPDISLPAKRGRGRPPKPKTPLPADQVAPPPKPRGRPPKNPREQTGSPKPRGRPPKKPRQDVPPAAPSPASGVKRGRGRPPKAKPVAAVGA